MAHDSVELSQSVAAAVVVVVVGVESRREKQRGGEKMERWMRERGEGSERGNQFSSF